MTARRLGIVATAVAFLACAPALGAYLLLGTTVAGGTVQVRWTTMPIKYDITNRDTQNVTASQLQTAVQAAFSTWEHVPTAVMSSSFAGFTSADPVSGDGISTIGFQNRPEYQRFLGLTQFVTDTTSGALLEADIFLNTIFNWSVTSDPNSYDVQSIATHEIGHLHGLGHSALGETTLRSDGTRSVIAEEAVMFPIAFPAGNTLARTLDADDIAAISQVYPTADFAIHSGGIAGRVTLNGTGLFGAHVIAFSPTTGAMVGAFSLNANGDFYVGGLMPGAYVVRVEPLDDADTTSFFDASVAVNINFQPLLYNKVVTVPSGGAGASIVLQVQSK